MGPDHQFGRRDTELLDRLAATILNHRVVESLFGLNGDADIDLGLFNRLVIDKMAVHPGVLLQGPGRGRQDKIVDCYTKIAAEADNVGHVDGHGDKEMRGTLPALLHLSSDQAPDLDRLFRFIDGCLLNDLGNG